MGCSGSKQNTKAKTEAPNPTVLTQKDDAAAAQKPKPKALIVCTSAAAMGDHATGAWSEEVCGPYYVFLDAGCDVTVCSVAGGDVPIDAGSLGDTFKTENDKRMIEAGSAPLKGTKALKDAAPADFDIVFFAGGHGTCVDFPTDAVGEAVAKALAADRVVACVCHGPMALVAAKGADGEPIVKGKKVACFTDAEEEQVGLTSKVPFLLQARLSELGAAVETAECWQDKAVRDGNLVTGQNPQSSVSCAKLALAAAVEKAAPAAEAPAAVAAEDKAAAPPPAPADAAGDAAAPADAAAAGSAEEQGSAAPAAPLATTIQEPVVEETSKPTPLCCGA